MHWRIPDAPAQGLANIAFPITIEEVEHRSGYFFAQQFGFYGTNEVGYTGVQPREDSSGSVLHAVFASFVPGSTTADANCYAGADGGPGVSCAVDWSGEYGRTYHYTVAPANEWAGTVVDTATQESVHIGSFELPAGIGGITGEQAGFVEWYPWNAGPTHRCEELPYQRSVFGAPVSPGITGSQGASFEYGDCTGMVDFSTRKAEDGYEVECGFRGV